MVHDVEALQNALLNNEDIIEEQDTAIGETESAYYYDDPYYSGDASKGQVGSYLLDAENDTAGQTFGPLIADDNDNEADVPPPAAGVPTVPPGNNAPVATNDTTTTDEDTAILNDFVPPATDVDGTIASYALVTDVAQGSLTFNPDGSYSFDPNGNFDDLSPGESRDVSFTYTAIDNNGATSAPATIDITITGTNDLPVVTGTVTGAVAEGDLGDTVTATGTIAIS
ncbi:MAG: cadherin-like domain-containing protein, partial [Desulfobacteraceae bacterium]|nr:cadherin-like domain-containing protein [Desulfobacteraceae bacterium]MBC2750009.1 cadherin-like domain-containing protein [Desulfobacteraceae bacterium]